jgi:hypothetical protein
MYAARDGGSTRRSLLLDSGAPFDKPTANGITPLLMADWQSNHPSWRDCSSIGAPT